MPLTERRQYTVSQLAVLDGQGSADPRLDPKLSDDTLGELYRQMVRCRRLDHSLTQAWRRGMVAKHEPFTGNEAAIVAATVQLNPDDWLLGGQRELAAGMMRGLSIESLLAAARASDTTVDQNAPSTLVGFRRRAAQLSQAVGIGEALKQRGQGAVLVFSDALEVETRAAAESLALAGRWRVPVVFVVTHDAVSDDAPVLAAHAFPAGFEGITVDGTDVLAVFRAASAALQRARNEGEPTLIECVVERLSSRSAESAADQDPQRLAAKWKRDPLARFRQHLRHRGLFEAGADASLIREFDREFDRWLAASDD